VTGILSEPELGPQVSLRGDPLPGFPTAPGTTAAVDGRTVLWLGPDEWLVIGGAEEDYPAAAAAVDVSASRVCFELSGRDGECVLAQGCSLDLHPAVFEPGRCAQTLLARVQVILFRPELAVWWILVRPSFAPYLRAWLDDARQATPRSLPSPTPRLNPTDP
jgi:heterotetrameric sarcosine oxidase gamma subunit